MGAEERGGNEPIQDRVLCAVLWKRCGNRICRAPPHRVGAESYVVTVEHMSPPLINQTFLAARECLYDGMREAGVPEE
jgi:hypothetical protein